MEKQKIFVSDLNKSTTKNIEIMALKIKEQNGTFKVEGPLNASTSNVLYYHFENLLNVLESVELNLDGVNTIDTNGLIALYKLYKKASILNRALVFTGSKSDRIYLELNQALSAA